MEINKKCETCEFNFDDTCVGKNYGKKVTESDSCDEWSASYDYYVELVDSFPWYIKNIGEYELSFDKAIDLMNKDNAGEEFELNVINVIMHIYELNSFELAELMNVSKGVITYSINRGVPSKRQIAFSNKLGLPTEYMNRITNLDLENVSEYAINFWKKNKRPKIKDTDFYYGDRERGALQKEISDYLVKSGVTQGEGSLLLGKSEAYISRMLAPSQKANVEKLSIVLRDLKEVIENTRIKYNKNPNNDELRELVELWDRRKTT